jgi:hypothetical protein
MQMNRGVWMPVYVIFDAEIGDMARVDQDVCVDGDYLLRSS